MCAQTVSTRPLLGGRGEGPGDEAILHDGPGEGACMQFEQRWYTAFCEFHSYTLYTVHTQAYASTQINCSFLLQLLRACTKHHAHVCRCQWLVLSFRQFPLLAMTNGLSTWHTCCCTTSTICHHLDSPLR